MMIIIDFITKRKRNLEFHSPGCWVVVRMFERSDLLSELGQVLQGIHRGFASLVSYADFNNCRLSISDFICFPVVLLPKLIMGLY